MTKEIEVKLIAPKETVAAAKEVILNGVVSHEPWHKSELKNTYFDTQDFKLRELRIGVRIREDEGVFTQTVKSSGKSIGGVHQRNEDETMLPEKQLNIDLVDDPYLKILLEEAQENDNQFAAVFTTNFVREKTILHFEDGTRIEMALDIGYIASDDDTLPISEVELELLDGNARHLFNLSRQLITEHEYSISNASKARRGYRLCSSLEPTHRRLTTIELTQGIEAEKAFEMICYSGLNHWQYYEQFVRTELAPESLLQMYRALLFIQNVYQLFGSLIPRRATVDLRANWNWMETFMSKLVQVARDRAHLQIMIETELVSEEELKELIEQNKSQVSKVVDQFLKLKLSTRYNLVMLGLSEWLFFKDWRKFMKDTHLERLQTPIVDFAKSQLEHTLRHLKKILNPKLTLSIDDYNVIVPDLRNALDRGLFFGELFDSKQRQKYRQPWLDLLAGTREFQFHAYAKKALVKSGVKTEEEALAWQEKRNDSVLEAMEQTRKAIFKIKPYWMIHN